MSKKWNTAEIKYIDALINKYPNGHIFRDEINTVSYLMNRTPSSIKYQINNRRKALNKAGNVSYTKKDDSVIIDCVRKYPGNLQLAFAEAAPIINRTAGSISQRYYKVLIKKPSNFMFVLLTKTGFVKNRKNIFSKHLLQGKNSSRSLKNKRNLCVFRNILNKL